MRRKKSELRKDDERMSNDVYRFLDIHFYNVMDNFERVNDKKRQLEGLDVIFSKDGKTYNADEKASVRYRNLKTYALELSFIDKKNELQDGWFLKKGLKTDTYVFVWIDKIKDEEFISLVVISKDKVIKHLENLGWTESTLRKKMSMIRDGIGTYMGDIYTDGCKFSYSPNYVEQPINILLPRKFYEDNADIIVKNIKYN